MSIWRRCRWVRRGRSCFSGVCVGRGYINDPERTRAAFLTDPDGLVAAGIAAVIMAGGGRTGSWSFWAAGIPS